MEIIKELSFSPVPIVASIGFFDGVHLGHKHLIHQVIDIARKYHGKSLIITFKEHPKKTLKCDYQPKLITTLEEKLDLMAKCGVDYCHLLNFTPNMAKLSSKEFMKSYLQKKLNVNVLVIGYDHHFGNNASLIFDDYKKEGEQLGIEVIQASKFTQGKYKNISSSTIRNLIQTGKVDQANLLTGHPYSLSGTVVTGRKLGRKIGYPTANIKLSQTNKILPLEGVYAVKVIINSRNIYGIANWGRRPTIEPDGLPILEIHLFDFKDDIYNQTITVFFLKYLREEKSFNSLEDLHQALQQDEETTRCYLNNCKNNSNII